MSEAQIPLEDTFADVVSKAMRGLVQTDAMVAQAAGLELEQVVALRTGHWNPEVATGVSRALGLNPKALVGLAEGRSTPPSLRVPGLETFTTAFDDMLVNSYLVWDAQSREAAAFDTGSDAGPMLEFLTRHHLALKAVFVTHTHGDHVFELDRLCSRTGAPAYVNALEPLAGAQSFEAGCHWRLGALHITAGLTCGHSRGGTTYVIRGLERDVAVVGDALFAASMGGAKVSYADALRTNRAVIFTLDENTVLCPGHGPLTTVGWERQWNPFFA
jgi:glyoxylase-like metal-dependent hydrolase (beta-lactamase superfamily II)